MSFFGNASRNDMRRIYLEAWRKYKVNLPMEPLEAQIADVITEHPEYHPLLNDPDTALAKDFTPEGGESNPFLHMAMHLAIRDQVGTDRPPGIRAAFTALERRKGKLEAEHLMSELLGETIWQSQRSGMPPDEQVYLRRVQTLAR